MSDPSYQLAARLQGALKGYEARPAQEAMAAAVARVLGDSGTLLVEAGTGTGKSLAYLLPALERAADSGGRVIVSTHTLNLQAQLLHQDLPLALSALGAGLEVVRAVGRGNYLCQLRLRTASEFNAPDLFGGRHALFAQVADWAQGGGGLREDAPVTMDQASWEAVQVEAFGCLGKGCPYAPSCAFLRDREALQGARVVVSNHALLMADLAARRAGSSLLPEAETLVVDEAHHLADVAGAHLGLRLHRTGLMKAFDRLHDPRRRLNLIDRLDGGSAGLSGLLKACRGATAELFERAAGLAGEAQALPPRSLDDTLSQPLSELAEALRRQGLLLKELPQGLGASVEAQSLAQQMDAASESLRVWLEQDAGSSVFWVDLEQGRTPVLRSAPLDVGPLLLEHLYPRHRNVILTSATLTVGGAFGYMRGRLGLGEDAEELALPAAFDYASQVEMHLSAAAPEPQDEEAYLDALERGIKTALERSLGRAFVLVTNFRHLRELAGRLRPFIEERGWLCLEQQKGARREDLLKAFKDHGQAVLFGAASFWEGVDVPGEALSCVIIVRLPFAVPDTPLERARQDRVREQGGEPFRDLSLPEAVLKLKQGFGRLIRHSTDRGWFVLLDPRALTRPYGRVFLASLPACPLYVDGEGPFESVAASRRKPRPKPKGGLGRGLA